MCEKSYEYTLKCLSTFKECDTLSCALIIQEGSFNINTRDRYGVTPLVYALRNKNHVIVEMLLDAGAWVNMEDADLNTVYHHAVTARDVEAFKLLTKVDFDSTLKNAAEYTAVDLAAATNWPIAITLLHERGINIDYAWSHFTPMVYATREGHTECVKELVRCGASVNSDHFSLVALAMKANKPELAEFLLQQGSDPHAGNNALFKTLWMHESIYLSDEFLYMLEMYISEPTDLLLFENTPIALTPRKKEGAHA